MSNEDVKTWVLGGAVLIIGAILSFIAKWFFVQMIKILKEIKVELSGLTRITDIQNVKITHLEDDGKKNYDRLNRHSDRIINIEKQIITLNDKSR